MRSITGQVRVRHYRDGVLLHEGQYKNGTTLMGRLAMVASLFSGGTAFSSPNWFMGLLATGQTLDDDHDVMLAVEPLFSGLTDTQNITEFIFDTPGNSRPGWVPQFFPNTNQTSFTSQNDVVFNIVNSGLVAGLFIAGTTGPDQAGGQEIGTQIGLLWATALFTTLQFGELVNTTIQVKSGDVLSVNYETRIADVTNIGLPANGGTSPQDGQIDTVAEYE